MQISGQNLEKGQKSVKYLQGEELMWEIDDQDYDKL